MKHVIQFTGHIICAVLGMFLISKKTIQVGYKYGKLKQCTLRQLRSEARLRS